MRIHHIQSLEASFFMSYLTDITGLKLNIQTPPKRIVSLVPSTTHSICELGKQEQIVGITHFCNRPSSVFKKVPKIGGTKSISVEDICMLEPDLVLANKEENTKPAIEALRAQNVPVFVAFPQTVEQALSDLLTLGTILHTTKKARQLVDKIQNQRRNRASFRYVYLIWNNPTMSISSQTFIASVLNEIGGKNLYSEEDRYPTIQSIPPDIDALFLSSEPFPFKEKHKQILSEQFGFPKHKIHLIDGAHCSWHGTNMQYALPYLHAWRDTL